MKEDFFNFVTETTKENFMNSQKVVMTNEKFNPYSDDLSMITGLLDKNDLEGVVQFMSVNTLLSSRAHLYKSFALDKLNQKDHAKSEALFARKIMEGIELTGDGSKQSPYLITQISDERDFVTFSRDEFLGQKLVNENNKFFDLVECGSGKKIYFDITALYLRLQELIDKGEVSMP